MHKTPPPDEEPSINEPSPSKSPGASVTARDSHSVSPRRRHTEFHSDEHPEIPKVRRASLQAEKAASPSSTAKLPDIEQEPVPPDTRLPRSERNSISPTTKRPYNERNSASSTIRLPEPDRSSSSSTRRPYNKSARAGSTARLTPPERRLDYDDEEYEDFPTLSPAGTRITVAPRRRPSVYEPPSAGSYRSRTQPLPQPRTLLSRWQDFSHNRVLMTLGLIILVTLVFSPVIFNLAKNLNNAQHLITVGSSDANGTSNSGQAAPSANSHEIVILPNDLDHPSPPVYATSAYLLDADTGTTLYANNPFMHLPMLSTTKLMTAILAAEKGDPNQQITITDAITRDINNLSADSSLMGIKKGETYSLRDLLYGLLLVSGNDAAIAIADGLSGNLPTFVAQMNARAQKLGMYDTHFMNPHGLLQQGHYSSAHDLALLGQYSMTIPLIHQISGTKEYRTPATRSHPEHIFINGNQFLWWYPGVDGGKPGWDGDTNFVQVVSSVRNHHHLIGVAMHTIDWWTDMRDLMNWGFNTFKWISPYDVDMTNPIPYDSDWNYFAKDKKERTIPTANAGRYYIYTGFSISGPIMSYFDHSKGLQKFGYPISLPKVVSDSVISQQFEHNTILCNTTTNQCTTT
jgi:D-alanyl-D-alanine carboxypeptidase